LPQRHLDDRHPVDVVQRLAQQRVGLGGGALRLQVVRLGVEHRIDLFGRYELQHLDRV
jgi:hypothetical protein